MASKSKQTVKARNTSASAGIDKHITGSVTIGGVVYTAVTLKQVFTDQNTAIDAADALETQWHDQVTLTEAANAKGNAAYQALRGYLLGLYGNGANAVLNDFGMDPPKVKGTRTTAVKAAAAEKAFATRKIRNATAAAKGTMVVPATAVTTIGPVLPAPTTTTVAGAPGATAAALPAAVKPVGS
ncbi:MAG TPA: hypothetical protein VGL81_14535 [Polyangiaceae bacterium]|jgi:hypothetical protein